MPQRLRDRLEYCDRRSIVGVALVILAATAALDYLTGTDINLFPLYWLPTVLVVWYVALPPGLVVGQLCVVVMTGIDMIDGHPFRHPALGLTWLFFMRSISFTVLCLLVAALRRRTRELDETAARLRHFNYSVAHDLRSPVRTIASFSGYVVRSEPALKEESRRHLARIEAASLRLTAMLDGLLLLNEVAEKDVVKEQVDLVLLARQVLEDLQTEYGGPERKFTAPASLVAFGDRHLVSVLMNNILQNAWKFTERKEEPLIELGALDQPGSPAFFVRDNGEGFDPRYMDQLFQPFRRLPNAKGFPGRGLGLATAARAVEAHGGRIWAETALGLGATFYFTLGPAP